MLNYHRENSGFSAEGSGINPRQALSGFPQIHIELKINKMVLKNC